MKYEKIIYPDGTSYVKVEEFSSSFTFRLDSYEDLWTLNQIRDVYRHNGKNAKVGIPCMLDAQADKRFNQNEPAGLKLVCNFLNGMGWEGVSIFHPHNPEILEALLNNVKIGDNSSFIANVLDRIGSSNLSLMSTDAGGFKPLMKLCDKIGWSGETYSASKSRLYDGDKSILRQIVDKEDFEGGDILIIDDISVFGGTFVGLAKLLKDKNVGKLYLAVSHLTVDNPNLELFKLFDKVFITNSKCTPEIEGLEIINLF